MFPLFDVEGEVVQLLFFKIGDVFNLIALENVPFKHLAFSRVQILLPGWEEQKHGQRNVGVLRIKYFILHWPIK